MSQIPPDSSSLDWLDDPFEPADMSVESNTARNGQKSAPQLSQQLAPLGFDDLAPKRHVPTHPLREHKPAPEAPVSKELPAPATTSKFYSGTAINGSSTAYMPAAATQAEESPFAPLAPLDFETSDPIPYTAAPPAATPTAATPPPGTPGVSEPPHDMVAKDQPGSKETIPLVEPTVARVAAPSVPQTSASLPAVAPLSSTDFVPEPVRLEVPPMGAQELLDLKSSALSGFEPLVQYMCRLNRLKRSKEASDRFSAPAVRDDIERILEQIAASAEKSGSGETVADKMPLLKCWVDVLIARTGFPFAGEWQPMGSASPDSAILGAANAAAGESYSSYSSSDVPLVHTCLCFCAELLRPSVGGLSGNELLEKLDRQMRTSGSDRICPRAYEGVFSRVIMPPVGTRVRMLLSVGIGVLLLAIAAAVILNLVYVSELSSSVKAVTAHFAHSQ